MKLTFHGHSCFELEAAGSRIIFDPWLTGNPLADIGPNDVNADHILLTHGHYDHIGDAIDIAKRTGAVIVAISELARFCSARGARTKIMNLGGRAAFPFGHIYMVPAQHSSSISGPDGTQYAGEAAGFILETEDKTVYHAGDTALFGDMRLIGERCPIDLALLPIGGCVTMGTSDAACAASLLGAKDVIPMHYNSFPSITANPGEFARELDAAAPNCRCTVLSPGESMEY